MSMHTTDAITLKGWMEKGEAVLVDVREPAEHAAEKIDGAILLPLSTATTQSLPPHTGKKLVIHCRSGKRSTAVCQKLLAEDANLELYNLEGGIIAWSSAGLAVVKSGKSFLPLDRQVQLAIGLILLVGSALGYMGTPVWFILTGLVGAGLVVAGLTGFCGLAMAMAKMPWNQRPGAAVACGIR